MIAAWSPNCSSGMPIEWPNSVQLAKPSGGGSMM
jgi:hypothetical protein